MTTIQTESRLTCAICGPTETLPMPADARQWRYERPICRPLVKPKPGDGGVLCSKGSVSCPPIQAPRATCETGCCR
jgi:hypothetical protein